MSSSSTIALLCFPRISVTPFFTAFAKPWFFSEMVRVVDLHHVLFLKIALVASIFSSYLSLALALGPSANTKSSDYFANMLPYKATKVCKVCSGRL